MYPAHEQKAFDLLQNEKENIKNVLNIGIVNLPHKMYEIDTLVRVIQGLNINPNITHLEIFERNCQVGRSKYPNHSFINGDVRNIKELTNEKFDLIFWWHGPEHVYENELVKTITDIETKLNNNGVIILGSPDGWQEQHNDDGNIHNDHYSGPDTAFYESIGYDVYRVRVEPFWTLVAYKKISE
jgi:hypothetical protein